MARLRYKAHPDPEKAETGFHHSVYVILLDAKAARYGSILRANPKLAIDQTAASGEYCFNSGLGTMVHFATQLERTAEDVVYEFDASGLIDPKLKALINRRVAYLNGCEF